MPIQEQELLKEKSGGGQMSSEEQARFDRLRKLYTNKCGQLEQAKISSSAFRSQVLQAEADAIKAELDQSIRVED